MSVVTSLPDVSELSHLDLDGWRAWFIATVTRLIHWLPPAGVAIFYQSDIRVEGFWIDKGYLVMRGTEAAAARVLWHKIVCRKPAGTIALGRASYSHMIAVTTAARASEAPVRSPDVLPDAGAMPWSRAMGVAACEVACRFLLDHTETRTVVDPFCGRGTVLAVANALGLDAIGVDIGAKRVRSARAFVVSLGAAIPAPAGQSPLDRGAELFDLGAYWDAHEVWESRWRVTRDSEERQLLQGLIQVAAALHKVVADAPLPAARLFSRGLAKLATLSQTAPKLDAFQRAVAAYARAHEAQQPGGVAIPSLVEALREPAPK
ncbi:MAG TPA: DUF309 domain-containing protein [Polyangiales bacterium]|nr:DUF309 domain-containing protein [Polyangiales bacterium]